MRGGKGRGGRKELHEEMKREGHGVIKQGEEGRAWGIGETLRLPEREKPGGRNTS